MLTNMLTMKEILSDLISKASITPDDAGCQAYMIQLLQDMGFECTQYDSPPVYNFFARYGTQEPLFMFAGHTDVVPIGEHSKWHTDPFCLTEINGMLYGRGTADMKGSLACMLQAADCFIKSHPIFNGSIGFLITSGEEGDHFDLGTPYVMEQLHQQGILANYCIVGEPSSTNTVGDVIKIGRRGSLTANIQLHGIQGHVAYPHLAENPIHKIAPALLELTTKTWDNGNEFFPPTSLQITEIKAGGQAGNIIPGEMMLQLNFRYSTEQTDISLKQAVADIFAQHKLQPDIQWRLNGQPFLTNKGHLVTTCIDAIRNHTKAEPELSTSGGTSDGRFIAPYGVEVVELGPVNATIHQVNECVAFEDLEQLSLIYYSVLEDIFECKNRN
jgi:succinyl-diaminopimelate desuccinylase